MLVVVEDGGSGGRSDGSNTGVTALLMGRNQCVDDWHDGTVAATNSSQAYT